MVIRVQGRRCTGSFSALVRTVTSTLLAVSLAGLGGCGGGSFDTGGPREETVFLGTTNLQQINDYFVTFTDPDGLSCANLTCHGTDPENGLGLSGGGGFKFRTKTWALLTAEQQTVQQLAFESRVDIANKPGSTFLLRATESSHSGSIGGSGGTPRYTASDPIYSLIVGWLQSTPAQ